VNDPLVQILLVLFGTGGVVVALIAAVRAIIPDAGQRLDRRKVDVARQDAQETRHHDDITDAREYVRTEIAALRAEIVTLRAENAAERARHDRNEEELRERIGYLEHEKDELTKQANSTIIENLRLGQQVKDMAGQQLVIEAQTRQIAELREESAVRGARVTALESEVASLRAQLGRMQNGGAEGGI
jgi:uncharacterized protein (DUF3084 family)